MRDSALSRLILYVLIACITAFISEFNTLTVEEIQEFDWLQWSTKIISVLLPGLITWRAFIDQSATRLIPDEYKDNI